MSANVILLGYEPQSGRSTLAAAMCLGLDAMGIPWVYVCPTEDTARHTSRRFNLPRARCIGFGRFQQTAGADFRAVVLDDVSLMPAGDEGLGPFQTAEKLRLTYKESCQIIVIE